MSNGNAPFTHGRSRPRPLHLIPLPTLVLLASVAVAAPHPAGLQFVSPLPDARLVSPRETIVLRPGDRLDRSTLAAGRIVVAGSSSGLHDGTLVLADDARTLVFSPARPFEPGERVTVRTLPGLRTSAGLGLEPLAFAFSVAPAVSRTRAAGPLESMLEEMPALRAAGPAGAVRRPERVQSGEGCDAMPAGYLPTTLLSADHPDPGTLFNAPFTLNYLNERGNIVILDNRGQPLFWRSSPATTWEFKRQPNGLLTYFTLPGVFMALDSTYAVVDSFKAGNGYLADAHDLQLLPNGHALLMAYDWEPVRMDSIVPGGNPDALVGGLIVQELDTGKNVVFQWRSWDHFQITDMDTCIGLLTDPTVDYVHGNAVELDQDGNLLISSRHLDEITKIDRTTGDVIWRFGLRARNNQFTFLNDTRGFSHQHDIRRLPNGHLSLFDNGNCFDPAYSRALEYAVDEVAHTALLVGEYRESPDLFSPFMGNVQHREDGGTTIGWGGVAPDPKVTELHADGTKAMTWGLGSPDIWSYRSFRFPWTATAFVTGTDSLDLGPVRAASATSRRLAIRNRRTTPLTIGCFISTDPAFTVSREVPFTLAPGATDSVDVDFAPALPKAYAADLYVRAVNDTEVVARVVALTGTGTGPGLSIDDVTAAEGASGTTPFTFTVSIQSPADTAVTVDYTTVDGTATVAGSDFLPAAGIATIPVGETSTTVTVEVVGDTLRESDETFTVVLSSPANAVIVKGIGVGRILDDDAVAGAGPGGLPLRLALHPAQPNPGRGASLLRYDLPRAGHATLEVFDVRGRKVDTLVDGELPAGRHTAVWTPRSAPAGLYYVRMRAGAFTQTRAVVLIR